MPTPQPATTIRHGSDDTSKQVYEPISVYTQPLTLHHEPPKDRSSDAPEATLPRYNYGQQQQSYSHLYPPFPSPSPGGASTDPVIGSSPEKPYERKSSRNKPSWLVAILVAVLAALIAATISGVAVWKVTEPKTSSVTCPNGDVDGSDGRLPPTGNVCGGGGGDGAKKAIRSNSGLAAVGWRLKEESFIQIVYQDDNDNLMTSWFSSMWANWTSPKTVAVEESGHKAKSGTPIAISTLWWKSAMTGLLDPQNQMNYLSPTGTVLGYNFALLWLMGWPDSIISKSYNGITSSSLASLWPYNYYQTSSAIMQVRDASTSTKEVQGIGNSAKGTPLLALPVGTTHSAEEVRLFYRNTDGKMALFERDSLGNMTDGTCTFAFDIPADAALGGFATARQAGGLGINTYVLWQDVSQKDKGRIRILSQTDGSKEWSGPVSDQVFSGADVPTRIACVNEGMGWGGTNAPQNQGSVPLSNKRDLNLCFFQADGGKLKQVWHDGTKWNALGYVRMS